MSREMLSKTVNNVFSTFAGQTVNLEKITVIVHSNQIVVIAKNVHTAFFPRTVWYVVRLEWFTCGCFLILMADVAAFNT